MIYVLAHTKLGFALPDLIPVLILIAVIVIVWVKLRQVKSKEEELKDTLSKLYAEDIVENEE